MDKIAHGMIITPSSTSAACVAHTSEKRLTMVCHAGHIY